MNLAPGQKSREPGRLPNDYTSARCSAGIPFFIGGKQRPAVIRRK